MIVSIFESLLKLTRSVKLRQKTCVLILMSRKNLSSLSLRGFFEQIAKLNISFLREIYYFRAC